VITECVAGAVLQETKFRDLESAHEELLMKEKAHLQKALASKDSGKSPSNFSRGVNVDGTHTH
jgi:hypothetical protein